MLGGSQEENDKSLEEDSGEDDTTRGTELQHSHLSPSHSTLHQYRRRRACTTLTLPLEGIIIVIQTRQGPAGPARPVAFTNPEADARAGPRRDRPLPAAQVRACATRHFRLQVRLPEETRPTGEAAARSDGLRGRKLEAHGAGPQPHGEPEAQALSLSLLPGCRTLTQDHAAAQTKSSSPQPRRSVDTDLSACALGL